MFGLLKMATISVRVWFRKGFACLSSLLAPRVLGTFWLNPTPACTIPNPKIDQGDASSVPSMIIPLYFPDQGWEIEGNKFMGRMLFS